jgi:tripartite-type tricarboxylate transporter receptor subunit TctC
MRLVALLLAVAAGSAGAQGYPARPVTLVAPTAAGDSIDALGRAIGEAFRQRMKQPLVVDNRPGANGNIAATTCKAAAADGYVLCLFTQNQVTLNPLLYKSLPYDPMKDFEPVSLLVLQRHALIVNGAVPARTFVELIEYSRKNPDKLNYASLGIGSGAHLVLAWLQNGSGVRWTHVPYKGGAQALTALIAGDVHIFLTTLATGGLLNRVQKGEVRALLARGDERNPLLPDVPSFGEVGLRLDAHPWTGLFAPAGAPKDVIARLAGEMQAIVTAPEFRDRFLTPQGFAAVGSTPEAFRAFIAKDFEAEKDLVRISGVRPE